MKDELIRAAACWRLVQLGDRRAVEQPPQRLDGRAAFEPVCAAFGEYQWDIGVGHGMTILKQVTFPL